MVLLHVTAVDAEGQAVLDYIAAHRCQRARTIPAGRATR
jgi:hypothetical protein